MLSVSLNAKVKMITEILKIIMKIFVSILLLFNLTLLCFSMASFRVSKKKVLTHCHMLKCLLLQQ